MTPKRYLGDSVYAEEENGMVKLTTENGYGPSNTIFLEWDVMVQLTRFMDDMIQAQNEAMEDAQ
jgi:hypothetical protein